MIVPLIFAAAYLIGSLPSAVWIGKGFYGIDVREHGSGNAGSTNTFRVLGFKPGLIVFILDVIKGFAAIQLSHFFPKEFSAEILILSQIGLGVAAVVGHIFPVFAKFKGGKGVASMLGIVAGILPWAALASFGIWLVVFTSSRIVSLSSIAAGLFFPLFVIFISSDHSVALNIFALVTAALLILTHKKNIVRLINKTEPRFTIRKQNSDK